MKEQGPSGKIEQKKLTTEPNPNRLERKGDIFMSGKERGGERGVPKTKKLEPKEPKLPKRPKPPEPQSGRPEQTGQPAPENPVTGGVQEPTAPLPQTVAPKDVEWGDDISPDDITAPEFRAVLGQFTAHPTALENKVLFEAFTNRYKEMMDKIITDSVLAEAMPYGTPEEKAARDAEIARLGEQGRVLAREASNTMKLIGRTAVVEDRRMDPKDSQRLAELEGMADGDPAKKLAIREFMSGYIKENAPEDEPLPDRVLTLIAKDAVATDEFVSRLMVSPLENEPWQIKGFYGNINFEKFTRVSRTIMEPKAWERLKNLQDANSAFHNMNYILRRNFDQFAQQSEALQPQHFQVLASIPGVAEGLTLYEQFYAEALAKNTRITEEIANKIEGEVEAELIRLGGDKEKGIPAVIKGMAGEEMQPWEKLRAYIYARDFFRVSVRAGEYVALSELPEQEDPSIFVSSPHAKLAQVLHPLKFTGLRFRPSKSSGGPELLDKTIASNTEKRKSRVRVSVLGGTSTDMRELQSVIAARGVYASWRNAEMALRQMHFLDTRTGSSDEGITDVTTFMNETHKREIAALKKKSDVLAKKFKPGLSAAAKEKLEKEREALREETGVLFAPLLENANLNLGLLVSPSMLNGATPEFKELVWEKIAKQDPLVMMSLLTRLETDVAEVGKPAPKAFEDILGETWGTEIEKRALFGTEPGSDAGKTQEASIDILKQEIEKRLKTPDKHMTTAIRGEIKELQLEQYRRESESLGMRELRHKIKRISKLTDKDKEKTADTPIKLDAFQLELNAREKVLMQILDSDKVKALTNKLKSAHRDRMMTEEARVRPQQPGESEDDFRQRLAEKGKGLEEYIQIRHWGKTEKDLDALGLGKADREQNTDGTWQETEVHFKERIDRAVQEDRILHEVTESGKAIAGDLSRIKQSYAWFLDDVPYQSLDWMRLGQYYDRQTGDLGNFSKASQGMFTFLNNPFNQKPDKVIEALAESVNAAGQVLGLESAQDNQEPILETYIQMIKEYTRFKWKPISLVAQAVNQPTSRAQEIVGQEAPSIDNEGTAAILRHALAKQITRKEDGKYDALRSRQNGMPFNVFYEDVINYGPLGFLVFLTQFYKALTSEK
jgi:hypothetical protein